MENIPYDEMEDLLHSLTATAMGFAFSFGVLVRFLQRKNQETYRKWFDVVALVVATVIPLIGWHLPSIDGIVQRVLFFVAYLWYGTEALNMNEGGKQ